MIVKFTAHTTALVDDGARIGDGSRSWHWVHVCAGAKIGTECVLGQNVFVANRVRIGAGETLTGWAKYEPPES